jgi:hypothetical protein
MRLMRGTSLQHSSSTEGLPRMQPARLPLTTGHPTQMCEVDPLQWTAMHRAQGLSCLPTWL